MTNTSATNTAAAPAPANQLEPTRRDFLYVATGAMAAAGAASVTWPFIDQMEPDVSVRALGGPMTVDLSSLQPGEQVLVRYQSKPIFVVRRTPAALDGLKKPSLVDRLRDPNSDQRQQPTYAKNWSRSVKPEYLVVVGICTHLGCIPEYTPGVGAVGVDWPILLPLPRLEIRSSRPGLPGRAGAAQPAGAALRLRKRQLDCHRQEPTREFVLTIGGRGALKMTRPGRGHPIASAGLGVPDDLWPHTRVSELKRDPSRAAPRGAKRAGAQNCEASAKP